MPNPTANTFSYAYPRPALTVDAVLVARTPTPQVLLIQRKHPPFAGHWALPGGFVEENEPLEHACRREVLEETGLACEQLHQLIAMGDPGRDPRGWTISVVFLGELNTPHPIAGDDAERAEWFPWENLPPLAFDHAAILTAAQAWLTKRGAGVG
jgi:8-oxo-dGTP diphosphatase